MRKPWNIPNLPVYSLSTKGSKGDNMNICTYVTAVSLEPKLYLVAIYDNTLTLENVKGSKLVVLQLLHEQHFGLVKMLGQKSGKVVNKMSWLDKKGMLEEWQTFPVIKESCAYVLLKKSKHIAFKGDHELFLFEVIKHKSIAPNCLTTGLLRQKNIIR
jgi:flavin reductase (DIM6/NTAB) family NADH-FMN oxidoreductase RutF